MGARYGPHQAQNVEARRTTEPAPALAVTAAATAPHALTDEESINVRIYKAASPAVANILTKATEYDFFMDPVPVEGAGSGFVIDPKGYILTNFHVVAGAQSIEVVLGDKTRFPAPVNRAQTPNDVSLPTIHPNDTQLTATTLTDPPALLVGPKVLAIADP